MKRIATLTAIAILTVTFAAPAAADGKTGNNLPQACIYPDGAPGSPCDAIQIPPAQAWCEYAWNDRWWIDERPVQWQAVVSGNFMLAYGFANGWNAAQRQCEKAVAGWRPPTFWSK